MSALGLLPALGIAAPPTGPVIRHALVDLPPGVPNYELAVLRLLLDRTVRSHGPCRLAAAPPMSQRRAFLQLAAGELDLTSWVTTTEHESHTLAVRIAAPELAARLRKGWEGCSPMAALSHCSSNGRGRSCSAPP